MIGDAYDCGTVQLCGVDVNGAGIRSVTHGVAQDVANGAVQRLMKRSEMQIVRNVELNVGIGSFAGDDAHNQLMQMDVFCGLTLRQCLGFGEGEHFFDEPCHVLELRSSFCR